MVRQEAREWERTVVNLVNSHVTYFNLLQGYCFVFCNQLLGSGLHFLNAPSALRIPPWRPRPPDMNPRRKPYLNYHTIHMMAWQAWQQRVIVQARFLKMMTIFENIVAQGIYKVMAIR